MRNSSNFLPLIMLGIILSLIFGFTPLGDTTTVKQNSYVALPEKVEQIALLNQSIKIDTAKNAGLCDTCYASVQSVVIENRIGVNKASEQNYEIAKLIASNEIEIERLAIINATLIKLRKKYELNYSMYFDRNLRMDKERILSIDTDLKRKLKQ